MRNYLFGGCDLKIQICQYLFRYFFLLFYYYYLTIDMCVLYTIIKYLSAIKMNIYNRPIVLV